jgi:hypothetical protein
VDLLDALEYLQCQSYSRADAETLSRRFAAEIGKIAALQ